jgi:hypothetical protein
MKKIALLAVMAIFSLMQANALTLTKVKPDSGKRGTKVTATLYGKNFYYYENVKLIRGTRTITPTNVTVYKSDSLHFTINISSTADTGWYDIIAYDTTGRDTLTHSFHIYSGVTKPVPILTSISPKLAKQGQSSIFVHIYGKHTSFTKDSSLSGYISKNSNYYFSGLSAVSDSELTGYLSIPLSANTGLYTVRITGSVDGSLSLSYFTVDTTYRKRELSGTITTSTGARMKHSWVYLVHYNASDTTIHATDSTMTDSSGHYSFANVSDSSTYVYIMPDSSLYPNEIPTYYDSTYLFSNARSVSLIYGSNNVSFSTLAGTNTGGTGFIGGSVAYCSGCKKGGSGAPAANVKVLLMDANDKVQRYTYTDAKGNFSFGKIALQKYYFWVDLKGVDNSLAPSFTLTSKAPAASKLIFTLYPGMLELNTTSGINDIADVSNGIEIYPNPFSQDIRIDYNLAKTSETSILIYDATGKMVYRVTKGTQPQGKYSLPTAELASMPAGLYLVQLHINGELIQKKIMKY